MTNYQSINHNILRRFEESYLKKNLPIINIGDTIRIKLLIQEGNKERIQISEGIVIAQHKANLNSTITVRKIFQGIGMERIYLVNSPRIVNIEVLKNAKVRRAKIYYLRNRIGKATRLKQKFN
uniref:ribosomal protein L19 n=1 Tax=Glaucosphaera vacuolata TaxID=38265 RepID=UPI001FCD00EC|nr:ribosomal protein L19 [Glaucosphaera vacuolata]UNJ18741.1 ribosomal protein L19 [Glaucosphaera vacuolata]